MAAHGKTDMENDLKRNVETSDLTTSLEPDKKKSKIDVDDDIDDTRDVCEHKCKIESSSKQCSTETKSDTLCDNKDMDSNQQSESYNNVENIPDHTVITPDSEQGSKLQEQSSSTVVPEFTKRMTEIDVGITEYLGPHREPFSAIIKQRYSDFIVNEIDEDGNIVHLKKVTHEEEKADDKEEDNEKTTDEFLNVLSEADQASIQKIVTDRNKDATHNILAPEDKSLRTKIHLAIKQSFAQMETSTTEDEKGNKVIKVMWRKGKTRDVIRDEWPQSKKSCRYVRFVLYKENKDTMDAIGLLAKNLRVRESMFQYAGSKDKRAKTTQEITAHRIHPKKLVNLNKVLWNMGLGDFRYVEHPLQLGQLSGNHFTIVLRNIQASHDDVDAALASLKDKGFINYFGMQRFGTTAVPTHRIGSALLKGDWERAIDLILAPRNDTPAKDKFQKMWAKTKDPACTLDVTPRYCGLERNILEALMKKAKPFNALEKLSRNTRLLYIHSYQSLVWNTMASRRLKQLGQGVVLGDLVLKRQSQMVKEGSSTPIVVTEDTIDNYTMTDVVLPLPGYDVLYPNNQVGDWYKELLTSDGLDIHNMRRPQKDYSLPGAYRQLLVIPKDVLWTHHKYDDYTQPLTLSDFDVIQGENLSNSGDSGTQQAVVLHMSLPSSCYATMALREAMRIDTSSFHQSSLNEGT